jgi:hypothetical protein
VTTAKSPQKRAAPRKAARSRAKNSTETLGNGLVQGVTQDVQNGNGNGNGNAADYQPPTDLRPPEEVKPAAPPPHPIYGKRLLYKYTPKDGSTSIDFPHINTVRTDPKFYWKIYGLNEMFQAFEWMNQAGVPREIQERVMDLPDAEKTVFFDGWFAAVTQPEGVGPPGES